MNGQGQHAQHAIGAVDERQPLLRSELQRVETEFTENHKTVDELTVGAANATLSDDGEGAVRERCQVTRAAEGSVLVHDGGDLGVEEGHVTIRDLFTNAGAPSCEGLQAKEHQHPDDLSLHLIAGTRGVRANETLLKAVARLTSILREARAPKPVDTP